MSIIVADFLCELERQKPLCSYVGAGVCGVHSCVCLCLCVNRCKRVDSPPVVIKSTHSSTVCDHVLVSNHISLCHQLFWLKQKYKIKPQYPVNSRDNLRSNSHVPL